MRHYDREDFRHLNDSERYRDYEYLADDGWIGPNERVPHGFTSADEPPWSTIGEWQTRPFAAERAYDEDRGQGRQYGRDLGLGYGRPHEVGRSFERTEGDHYDRGYHRPRTNAEPQRYDNEKARGYGWEHQEGRRGTDRDRRFRDREETDAEHARSARGMIGGVLHGIRHPGGVVRRVVRGIFHGRGPKNWVRSDARIHDEVCERLAEHPDIDASEIEVTVSGGEVTLVGTVQDRREKYLAEDIIDDVVGVKDVHNRLRFARGAGEPGQRTHSASASSSTAASRR